MKILSASQIRLADQFTIENEPISSIDLMERASEAFVSWFTGQFKKKDEVLAVCGTGNNGGDGLAISRMLLAGGYKVKVAIAGDTAKGSEDFKTNLRRLEKLSVVVYDTSDTDFQTNIIIDALFGSGLSRPVTGGLADLIKKINDSEAEVVAVDIPSGLYCDDPSKGDAIVEADNVVTFQLPKLAFLLPENGRFVKNWATVDIGLNTEFISSQDSNFQLIELGLVREKLKKRPKFFHKGQAGKALLVTGSKGKMGAAVLCAKACLRSGVGLLEVHIPEIGNTILQTAVPEAMVLLDKDDVISETMDGQEYDAIGFGPGLGTEEQTYSALRNYLENQKTPVVIDADALNLISLHPDLLNLIPPNSILTPHPGEFKRLAGSWADDFQRLKMQVDFSTRNKVIIILKNAHSSISLPNGSVFFNSTGNPGMATGGSGDVLTGIITGLLSQGYSPQDSSTMGVYIHGLAGDLASKRSSEEGLIASDIIEFLPNAFKKIRENS